MGPHDLRLFLAIQLCDFPAQPERLQKKYFVAFVSFIHIQQFNPLPVLRILLPSLYILHKEYVHIPYGVFVALDFLKVSNMGIYSKIRLFSECFKIAGTTGLIACA